MIRILLLDDHGILREGIKRLLENEPDFDVCGECETVTQAFSCLQQLGPDVLISDISLGDTNSFPLIESLTKAQTGMKVLMLSMHDNPAFVGKAMSLGVSGYVTKASAAKELIPALRAVLAGQHYVSSDIRPIKQSNAPKLTQRELDTLRLLIKGVAPKAIGMQLGINDKTVYGHRANLMLKLQARNLAELQEMAVRFGLLD